MTECSWWSHLSRGSLCLWWAAVAPAMAQDVKSQAWKPAVYSDHFDEWAGAGTGQSPPLLRLPPWKHNSLLSHTFRMGQTIKLTCSSPHQ